MRAIDSGSFPKSEALQSEGFEVVKSWLQREHARNTLPAMKAAMADPSANAEKLEEMARNGARQFKGNRLNPHHPPATSRACRATKKL